MWKCGRLLDGEFKVISGCTFFVYYEFLVPDTIPDLSSIDVSGFSLSVDDDGEHENDVYFESLLGTAASCSPITGLNW